MKSIVMALVVCLGLWVNNCYADGGMWVPVVRQEVVYVPVVQYYQPVVYYQYPVVYQYRPWIGWWYRPSCVFYGGPTSPLVLQPIYRY